jgi:hypothetical protein
VAAMMAMIAVPAYRYTIYLVSGGTFPGTELAVCAVAALIVNLVLIVFPLRMGARAFTKREF